MKRFVILALAVMGVVSTASALTLKEKKQYTAWVEQLNDPKESYGKSVKEKCGYDMPATLDEKFTTTFMEANSSASSYCDEVRSKIAYMCEDKTSKDAIKAKVKKVSCVFGKEKEVAFKLNGGTLTVTLGINASNIGDKTKEFLENNL